MKEMFTPKRFSDQSEILIFEAQLIIQEYMAAGFTLTLRQLYYQFVARGLIPNNLKSYRKIQSVINDARLAGRIDWDAIEDRTRNLRKLPTWNQPSEIIGAASEQYLEDCWADQPYRVEVWIEKDALVGVIEAVCNKWRVPYLACRGFCSQSEQYAAGQRLIDAMNDDQEPIIIHLGDHDPSGIDMTRDNEERLSMFAYEDIRVDRIALNIDQVEHFDLPPNPAKMTDSRSTRYVAQFGSDSWELDALDPKFIERLIDEKIRSLVDQKKWERAIRAEKRNRNMLKKVAQNWLDVQSSMKGKRLK